MGTPIRSLMWGVGFLLLIGCAATVSRPTESPRSPSPATATPDGRSPAATIVATPSPPTSTPSSSSAPDDADALLLLCENDPSTPPSDIDCRDAIGAALLQVPAGARPIRALMAWKPPCAKAPCGHPDPNAAYVDLFDSAGEGVVVPIHLLNGTVEADPASVIPADAVPTASPVPTPASQLGDVGKAPASISARPPFPLCGDESAGLAGPFDRAARECFLSQATHGVQAEFVSHRSDSGGAPFTELWRSSGRGPVVIFTGNGDQWDELTCAVLLLPTDQVIDHTDCVSQPVT